MSDIPNDIQRFKGNIVENISHLHNVTCYCEADLINKLSLRTPGKIVTKIRSFKFNFAYLFSLSQSRRELDPDLKKNIQKWLDLVIPLEHQDEYAKAGMILFRQFCTELERIGILTYKT